MEKKKKKHTKLFRCSGPWVTWIPLHVCHGCEDCGTYSSCTRCRSSLCMCRILRTCRFQLKRHKFSHISFTFIHPFDQKRFDKHDRHEIYRMRTVNWEHLLLEHSQGSIVQVMSRCLFVRWEGVLSLRWVSVVNVRQRVSVFIVSREQQRRVQKCACHAARRHVVNDCKKKLVHTVWITTQEAGQKGRQTGTLSVNYVSSQTSFLPLGTMKAGIINVFTRMKTSSKMPWER